MVGWVGEEAWDTLAGGGPLSEGVFPSGKVVRFGFKKGRADEDEGRDKSKNTERKKHHDGTHREDGGADENCEENHEGEAN